MKKGIVLRKDKFFKQMDLIGLALTYNDVRLKTGYSEVLPANVDVSSRFSRDVPLKKPLVSAPMDTVSEYPMCITMALQGGLGIIHRNLTIEAQIHHLERVKYFLQGGFINNPICIKPNQTVEQFEKWRKEKEYDFHSFLVIDNDGRLIGLVSGDDFDFCLNPSQKIADIMSTDLVVGKKGIAFQAALNKMRERKKKVLPVVDRENRVAGLYIWSDIKRTITGNPEGYNIDALGRLRVGVAIGVGDESLQRAEQLIKKGVDVLVIDSAHGDSKGVFEILNTVKEINRNFTNVNLVAGNVSEGKSTKALVDAGVVGVKVGQGPGSICTTRIIAGIGCPQITAIHNCEKAIRGSGVPIIADGGIQYSGDITLAIGAGASCVMIGNLFAGTKESPGEIIIRKGRPYKLYRGMGSLSAMEESRASRERYGQNSGERGKLVPEGIEGIVPYKGEVDKVIFQLIGGLRAGMGYVGAKDIPELQKKADFRRISNAGSAESHPHDVTITKEAPNYAATIDENE